MILNSDFCWDLFCEFTPFSGVYYDNRWILISHNEHCKIIKRSTALVAYSQCYLFIYNRYCDNCTATTVAACNEPTQIYYLTWQLCWVQLRRMTTYFIIICHLLHNRPADHGTVADDSEALSRQKHNIDQKQLMLMLLCFYWHMQQLPTTGDDSVSVGFAAPTWPKRDFAEDCLCNMLQH